MANTTVVIGAIIVILIVGALVIFGLGGTGTGPSGSGTSYGNNPKYNVPVGVTDPPSVPAGTQAVLVTYSNVQVYTTGSNSSGWVTASGSGTVNMLAVVNASQTIADAYVAANSTITAIRMNVTSVKVIVNGTTYSASYPSEISASVSANQSVKSDTAVLVDASTDLTSNSTATSSGNANAYVFTTSAKAVLTTNATVSVNVGSSINLSTAAKGTLGLNI